MNIFEIIKNLYTNPKADWILYLDDSDINPVIIQRFLALDKYGRMATRKLNKFVFTLSPKMYLSSMWSMLFQNGQKFKKTPFIKYPKKNDKEHKYKFIHDKIKKQFDMSEKDFKLVESFVNKAIDEDKITWFSYYGAKKSEWKKNEMDISAMKTYIKRPDFSNKGTLSEWF